MLIFLFQTAPLLPTSETNRQIIIISRLDSLEKTCSAVELRSTEDEPNNIISCTAAWLMLF
jgi:hypothetical protein